MATFRVILLTAVLIFLLFAATTIYALESNNNQQQQQQQNQHQKPEPPAWVQALTSGLKLIIYPIAVPTMTVYMTLRHFFFVFIPNQIDRILHSGRLRRFLWTVFDYGVLAPVKFVAQPLMRAVRWCVQRVVDVATFIEEKLVRLLEFVGELIAQILQSRAVRSVIDFFTVALPDFVRQVLRFVYDSVVKVVSFVVDLLRWVQGKVRLVVYWAVAHAKSALNFCVDFIRSALRFLRDQILAPVIDAAWRFVLHPLLNAIKFIVRKTFFLISKIWSIVAEIVSFVIRVIKNVVDVIISAYEKIADALFTCVAKMFDFFWRIGEHIADALSFVFDKFIFPVMRALSDASFKVFEAVRWCVRQIFRGLRKALEFLQFIVATLREAANFVREKVLIPLSEVVLFIFNKISAIVTQVTNFICKTADLVVFFVIDTIVAPLITGSKALAAQIYNFLLVPIGRAISAVMSAAYDASTAAFSAVYDVIASVAPHIWKFYEEHVVKTAESIVAGAKEVAIVTFDTTMMVATSVVDFVLGLW